MRPGGLATAARLWRDGPLYTYTCALARIHARRISQRAAGSALPGSQHHWPQIECRTILVPSPSHAVLSEIIDRLPVASQDEHTQLHAVFFLTPSFAQLLGEHSDFLAAALARIFPFSKTIPSARGQCSTLAAVVDWLPSLRNAPVPTDHGAFVPDSGAEGVSVLIATSLAKDSIDLFGDVKPSEHGEERDVAESGQVAVHCSFETDNGTAKRIMIDVPLANTILQTGKESMMVVSKWARSLAVQKWLPYDNKEISSVQLKLPQLPVRCISSADLQAPLLPLTTARQIADAFGNILNQVYVDNDEIVGASRELEDSINGYVRSHQSGSQQQSVWALVLPGGKIFKDDSGSLSYQGHVRVIRLQDDNDVQKSWTGQDSALDPRPSELLMNGARLHRVISGGGGWGPKQGLLSLDPGIGYSDISGKAMPNDVAKWKPLEEMVHQVARPGDFVQFYLSPPGLHADIPLVERARPSLDHRQFHKDPKGSRHAISLAFGVTPSTVDSMPVENQAADVGGTQPSCITLDGHFGALSGHGLALSLASKSSASGSPVWKAEMATRIEAPYSKFSSKIYTSSEN